MKMELRKYQSCGTVLRHTPKDSQRLGVNKPQKWQILLWVPAFAFLRGDTRETKRKTNFKGKPTAKRGPLKKGMPTQNETKQHKTLTERTVLEHFGEGVPECVLFPPENSSDQGSSQWVGHNNKTSTTVCFGSVARGSLKTWCEWWFYTLFTRWPSDLGLWSEHHALLHCSFNTRRISRF